MSVHQRGGVPIVLYVYPFVVGIGGVVGFSMTFSCLHDSYQICMGIFFKVTAVKDIVLEAVFLYVTLAFSQQYTYLDEIFIRSYTRLPTTRMCNLNQYQECPVEQ